MKIILNHTKLAKALSYTSRAVSAKPNIPILSNVLVDVDNGNLKLSATNLDMGINMWISGQVEADGKVTINAKYISDFVSAASSDTDKIEMNLVDNNVLIKTENSKASFNIIPAEEYPVLPKVSETPIFKINANDFISSMEKVIFACSTDLSAGRIQYSGVLFEINKENNEITFVGLDGFRLSKRVIQLKGLQENIQKEEIIVPSRYLGELTKILQDYHNIDEVEVFLSENNSQIIFKFDDIEFSIRLLEGPYPEYKKTLPDSSVFSFEVKKKDIENAIKIANTFARGNLGNRTLFDFDLETSKLTLKSTVAEIGEGESVVIVSNAQGESDLRTAYTLRYLQDLVNHIKGDTMIFETKGQLAASIFKDKDDSQFLHLIMPMRREV
jgi:DNA polymerase-3 subunit beta